jgi:hypothetical protein
MSADGPSRPGHSGASALNPYAPPAAAIDAGGVAAAEADGFKSALPQANAVAGVMALHVLAELTVAVNAVVSIGVMKRELAAEAFDQAQLSAINGRTHLLTLLLAGVWLAAIVAYCLFMPRANRNARAFGSPMSNTPGWAAGWFFVPIAYLWKPYYAMKEIWQGSDPDPTVPALLAPVAPLLPLWWWTYLTCLFSRQIWGSANRGEHDPSTFMAMSWMRIVISAITIVAAFLAAAVVRRLARRQDERQRRRLAGPPITAGVAP